MLRFWDKQYGSNTSAEQQGEVIHLRDYRIYEDGIDFTKEVEVSDTRPSLALVPTLERTEVDEGPRDPDGPLLTRVGNFATSLLGHED
ncbi:MAG TPA: hypothetical protein VD947_01210 [Patescibacteria group bacterium]|nr:hypothetical protein [Patescibacteria group bacterium]